MAPHPIEEDWFESPLAPSYCRIVALWSFQFRLFEISLLFSIDQSINRPLQKKANELYQAPPRLEPMTFLIHDLERETWRSRPLDHRRPTPISSHYGGYFVLFSIDRDRTKNLVSLDRFIHKPNFSFYVKQYILISKGRDDKPNLIDHPKSEHFRFSSCHCSDL